MVDTSRFWLLLVILQAASADDTLTFAEVSRKCRAKKWLRSHQKYMCDQPFQGDQPVIQRDQTTLVWGTAPSFAGDSVQVDIDGQLVANGNITGGTWRATLPPQNASFKSTITVSAAGGSEPLTARIHVSFGDVILCAGQVSQTSQTATLAR